MKNRHAVLYWISFVYQLENIIHYRLSKYGQNVILVQHYSKRTDFPKTSLIYKMTWVLPPISA